MALPSNRTPHFDDGNALPHGTPLPDPRAGYKYVRNDLTAIGPKRDARAKLFVSDYFLQFGVEVICAELSHGDFNPISVCVSRRTRSFISTSRHQR